MKWFAGKTKILHSIHIQHHAAMALEAKTVIWLLFDVSYESGLPETYLLPIAFANEADMTRLGQSCPQAMICHLKIGEVNGALCDGLYITEVQHLIFQKLATSNAHNQTGEIIFEANDTLRKHAETFSDIKPRIHAEDEGSTSLTYDNKFFLRIYRKIDITSNPDVEISDYLTNVAHYEFTPAHSGIIKWHNIHGVVEIGLMQAMVENHGDGNSYMLERLHNYIERILARDRNMLQPEQRIGSLAAPVAFSELPDDLQILLGAPASEQARLIGVRTAEMHLALAAGTSKDFKPEDFSLHYQRSLFASMLSLVRGTYQVLNKNWSATSPMADDIRQIIDKREIIQNTLKRIHTRKLDVIKIRIHGNFGLSDVLLTGKDIAIQNFSGDPTRTYSERKLKRSSLRDVATMIRSIYTIAYKGFFTTTHVQKDEIEALLPFAELWAFYMSSFFVGAYLDTVRGSNLVPNNQHDIEVMLQTYLLEKSIADLNQQSLEQTEKLIVPVKLIQTIIT